MIKGKMQNRILIRWFLAAVFLAVLALVPEKAYASVSPGDQSWSFVLYNNNNGMPFSESNTMAQTPDGFVYVGSYGGLLRFDGEDFYRFEDTRLINVISLFVDSRGRLWIGTNSNGFSIMEDGEFTYYPDAGEPGSNNIRCFAEEADGSILIGSKNGIFCMDAEGQIKKIEDPRLGAVGFDILKSDTQGTVYGLTRNGDVAVLENHRISGWISAESVSKDIITSIYPDPTRKGYLYFGMDVGGFLYGNPLAQDAALRRVETPGLVLVTDMLYKDGRLWIATDRGIAFINEYGQYIRPDSTQRSNAIRSLMADLEGNIWAASYRLGVIKMSPGIFTNINSLASLQPLVVNTTYMRDGILYIGSDTGLICLDEEYRTVQTPVSDLLANERIRCIYEDREGRLWFCTYGEEGVVCLEKGSTYRQYTKNDGFHSTYFRDVYEMEDGTIVISVRGGLYFLKDLEVVDAIEDSALPNQEILCMYEDRPGHLLIGTNGNGIYAVEDGEVKTVPGTEILSGSAIMRIRNRPGSDELWVISGTSLYTFLDGVLTEVKDIPNLHNYDIVFDQRGFAWILAADGIYIGDADSIVSGEPVRYMHYDYRSGLPFVVTPHCRNYLSEDGLLYMSGNDGVVRININEDARGHADVQLAVPFVDVDDETVILSPGETLVLSSGVRRVWVHPYALTYSLNEPTVMYQLEGFDEEMGTARRSELPSFIYTNLRGGNYTFRFAVIDPVTGEIKKEIQVPIIKKKAFYEQALFWVFCWVLFLGFIDLGVRRYLRIKTREIEDRHEQDRIKTELSVAREIQASALPRIFPAFPDRKEIDLYASMDPAKEVAGDFYDFFPLDQDHVALVIADVSGKGVGAALFMMASKNTLKNTALSRKFSGPGEILAEVNDKLCDGNEANMFVTVWLGILTLSTGHLVTANAGHEYPVLLRKKTGFRLEKDKHGLALGIMSGMQYRESEWMLKPGDGVFVYTDGVPEATNAAGELFGNDRMVEALNRCRDRSVQGILSGVRSAVDQYVGDAPQYDDLTMLAVQYFGTENKD